MILHRFLLQFSMFFLAAKLGGYFLSLFLPVMIIHPQWIEFPITKKRKGCYSSMLKWTMQLWILVACSAWSMILAPNSTRSGMVCTWKKRPSRTRKEKICPRSSVLKTRTYPFVMQSRGYFWNRVRLLTQNYREVHQVYRTKWWWTQLL